MTHLKFFRGPAPIMDLPTLRIASRIFWNGSQKKISWLLARKKFGGGGRGPGIYRPDLRIHFTMVHLEKNCIIKKGLFALKLRT